MANTRTGKNETLSDWKVVFLCTFIYFFQFGTIRSSSLFFVEFLNRFNIIRQNASIPFILCRILYVLTGPLFGFLGTYFQLRTVITFGSFLSSFGLIACFWAEDIIFLSLFWGIFLGFGSGTAIALLQEIINRHFDKHISTAMGVYIAGASIGGTILPYITKTLFDKYGLSGAFLIIGGLFLNIIPLSLALPLYPEIKSSSKLPQNINRQEDIQSEELYVDNKIISYTSHSDSQITEERRKTAYKKELIFTLRRNCYAVNESHQDVKRPNLKKTFNLSAFGIFLNPIFLALCTIISCGAIVFSMMNTIFIDYCLEKGLTSDQSVYAFMIISATDLVGRIGLGWITDCGYVEAVKFVGISYVVVGLTCLIYIWSKSFLICVAASLTYGTFFGVVESYCPKILKDYIEPSERTMAVASRRIIFLPICASSPFIIGVGAGTAYALLQEIINRNFDKHLSTAMGVYIAGSSIGATVLPYITKVLLDHYGLSGAFINIGGLVLHTIPLSLALPVYLETKNSSTDTDRQKKIQSKADNKVIVYTIQNNSQVIKEREKTLNNCEIMNKNCHTLNESRTNVERLSSKQTFNFSMFRIFLNPIFFVLCTIMGFSTTIYLMMNTVFIDYGLEKNLTSDEGVFALAIFSVTDLVGRLGLGWITDYGFIDAEKFVGCSFVVIGLTYLMYIWSRGFIFWIVVSVTCGTFFGVVESYCPKLFKDYIEPSERTMAVASRRTFFIPICIASPFIFGYFKDTMKSYDGLMYALAVMSFVTAALSFYLPFMAKQPQKPSVPDQQQERF